MKSSHYISLSILLSILFGSASCFFIIKENYPVAFIFVISTIILFFQSVNSILKIFKDVDNFVEAVKYRDFTKRYAEKKNHFYRYFNDITDTFLDINREKETQQQYLKKILELVDTGILAYNVENNDTLWMNESLKNMLRIPYVKNINWLRKRYESLYNELTEIPLGKNRLISINVGNQVIKSLTNASSFETNKQTYKLIAFHNINATLEEVEASAWKGLLSVMTHEIMNSIAPVASLADTLKKRMEIINKEISQQSNPEFEDVELAMETIRRRSEGLLKFAETYRSLSKTIIPEIAPENLKEMLSNIYQLMQPSLKQKGISLEINSEHPLLTVTIDRNLIEQVLINFITNATHALTGKETPRIILFSGITTEGNPYITVADNGKGISPEVRDKIFIPFFSTRKNGSGIGLSLSREIVKLHKANLQVQSKEGEGSAFTILFPQDILI